MDTKRCAYCHKLLRVDTQICSRCGHATLDKRRKTLLKEITHPSLPPASPHRLGHYSGLHPEDQPYQSSFIAVQRPIRSAEEEEEVDDTFASAPPLPHRKEPEHILLPNVPEFIEDVPTQVQVRQHVQEEAPHEFEIRNESREHHDVVVMSPKPRTPRTRKLSPEQLEYPEQPIHVTEPVSFVPTHRPHRLIPVLLSLSVIFFLLASGILAFAFLKKDTALASPVLEANPSILRVNDTFVLTGHDFNANNTVKFTRDSTNEPIVDVRQQPMTAFTDDKGKFSVQIVVPPTWKPGEHAIHATDESQELSRTTTITIQQPPVTPPKLQLLSSTLDVGADRAGTTSSGQVTLINMGGGQLAWQESSDSAWLTASPTDNSYVFSGRSLVNVTVNRSHLVPKTYMGHITFSQRNSSDSVKLTVTMKVKAAPPALNVSPASLSFSASSTQAAPVQSITLQNSGGQALDWQASATTNDGANWLYISQASGHIVPGNSQTIDVTVIAQQLVVGSYQGIITLSGGASASLPVFLTVVAPGTLVISPISLTFQSLTGQGVKAQTLILQNSGGQSLNWSAGAIEGVMGGSTNWLSITPTNGSIAPGGQAAVVVTVNSASLNAGAYQGTVMVNSGGTSKQVPISLTLTTPPAAVISLQTSSLNFTTPQGSNPTPQDFTITNTGNAVLNWNATESGNGETFAPLSPKSGSLAPQANAVISVSPSVANDGPSTLTTTITIADSDSGTSVASQKLTLTITIQSQAAIGIAPQTNFNLDTTNNTQAVTITNSGTATLNWTSAVSVNTANTTTSGTLGATATVTGTGTPASGGSSGTPIPTNGPWLSVDIPSGTLAPGQSVVIHIACNGTGLTPGTYQGQITISDSDVGTTVTPRTIYVTFIV